jgi:hypothetical protein
MQARMVLNLVNQTSVCGDWQSVTRAEFEKEITEKFLPNFSAMTYYNMTVDGNMRIVSAKAVTDFFVEERDETQF